MLHPLHLKEFLVGHQYDGGFFYFCFLADMKRLEVGTFGQIASLGNCRGLRVRGQGSRVRSRGSQVEGRMLSVIGRGL